MVAAWLGTKAIVATHHFKDFGLLDVRERIIVPPPMVPLGYLDVGVGEGPVHSLAPPHQSQLSPP